MTPDDIEHHRFPTAADGYDQDEVRAFLRRLAAEVRREREELAGSRSEVDRLLEQARVQGELLRFEAAEASRRQARATTDRAQRRLEVLRVTEQASRDRIRAAQEELERALRRLDGDPGPAVVPLGTDVVRPRHPSAPPPPPPPASVRCSTTPMTHRTPGASPAEEALARTVAETMRRAVAAARRPGPG